MYGTEDMQCLLPKVDKVSLTLWYYLLLRQHSTSIPNYINV